MRLEWVIVLLLFYTPVYIFNGAILEPLPKIVRRKLNRIESIILLPLGMFYTLFFLLFFLMIFSSIDFEYGLSITLNVLLFFLDTIGFSGEVLQKLPTSPLREVGFVAMGVISIIAAFLYLYVPFLWGNFLGRKRLYFSKDQYQDKSKEFDAIVYLVSHEYKKLKEIVGWRTYCLEYIKIFIPMRMRLFFRLLGWYIENLMLGRLIRSKALNFYLGFISVDQTPVFAKNFTSKIFDYILDVRLKNGKFFSGILEDYDIKEDGEINYISLKSCLKWKRDEDGNEIIKDVSGDVFTIPFNRIEEINVSKKPQAQIFIIEKNIDEITRKIDEIRRSNSHREWIFSGYQFIMIDMDEASESQLRKYVDAKLRFLCDKPNFYRVENREYSKRILDCYLNEKEKEHFVNDLAGVLSEKAGLL